ncbi:MAG: GNAT family N-acetyltransferase, partial [Oscillospiraceae bacterium]
MYIRRLEKTEISDALNLIWDTFLELEAPDYEQKGVNTFRACLDDREFTGKLTFYGAFEIDKLVGVITTRNDGNHIAQYFVLKEYHRQGIGRKLFEFILPFSTGEKVTVNSSPYAVEVYHRLGFKDTDSERVT